MIRIFKSLICSLRPSARSALTPFDARLHSLNHNLKCADLMGIWVVNERIILKVMVASGWLIVMIGKETVNWVSHIEGNSLLWA